MFTCAIGHSDDIDTGDAVAEALRQCEARLAGATPGAAMVFCGIDYDHAEVLRWIGQRHPGLPLIGCTTDGELSGEKAFTEESVLIALFASDVVTFRSGVGVGISTAPAQAAATAIAEARFGDTPPSLVLMVSDGFDGERRRGASRLERRAAGRGSDRGRRRG